MRRFYIIFLAVLVSYAVSGIAAVLPAYFPGTFIPRFQQVSLLLTGILLSDIIIRRRVNIKVPGVVWFFTFLVYVVLHGLYPGNNQWFTLAYEILKIYGFFLIIINFIETEEDYIILRNVYVFFSVITLLLFFFKADVFRLPHTRSVAEEAGFLYNINTFSYLAVLTAIIYNFPLRDKYSSKDTFIQLCLLAGAAFIVVYNATRGASMIMFLIGIIFLRKSKYFIAYLFAFFLLGYLFIFQHLQSPIDLLMDRISGTREYQSEGRWQMTVAAWRNFLDAPLWGKGYDFLFYYWIESINHLWYLNVLVAYGILGLAIFLFWFKKLIPLNACLSSRYSIALLLFITIYLFFAPILSHIALAMAFLYQMKHKKSLVQEHAGIVDADSSRKVVFQYNRFRKA